MKNFALLLYNILRRIYKMLPIPRTLHSFMAKHIFAKMIFLKSFLRSRYYEQWVIRNGYNAKSLAKQRALKFPISPKISIVVPMYNTDLRYFEVLIQSLKDQTYDNWELCLADGSDKQDDKVLELCNSDPRIKYIFPGENKGISGNTNEALKLATGDYIGFMDHDDFLPTFSLFEIVKFINENPDAELIYTDETHYYEKMKKHFHSPHFKPKFSPDYLRSLNYITHFTIIKKELLERVGKLRSEYDGSQDYDFILRASELTDKIYHIPLLLYHWRIHDESYSSDITPSRETGKKAIEDHLKRVGLKGTVHLSKETDFYNVEYDVIGKPSVSIIIPNKDQVKLLKSCIDSITQLTTYTNYEIVIIENNSEDKATFDYYETVGTTAPGRPETNRIRIITYPEKGFNYSKLINFGVKNCTSDYIVQLNNDTVLLTPNWLELMLGFAQRKDVGAVGAKLYFPDKTFQHVGVAIPFTADIPCGHMFGGLPKGDPGYMARTTTIMNYRAVTGACLMCRRDLYEKVGYMDENLAAAYNDADFCMKLIALGLVNVYNPNVELLHFESKSRKYNTSPGRLKQFNREKEYFSKKWAKELENSDPYYNMEIENVR